MKKLLEFILTNITGNKDFSINETVDGDRIDLEITAKPEEIGLIIGKGGKIIKSIQNLLRVKARIENKSVFVNVKEKE